MSLLSFRLLPTCSLLLFWCAAPACEFGYNEDPNAQADVGPSTDGGELADAATNSDGPTADAGAEEPADAALPHEMGELGPGLATLVGTSTPGFVDGARNVALFDNPVNVAALPDGRIAVADFHNHAVRAVSPSGEVTTLVRQEGFGRPFGMLYDHGTFYVQTDYNTAGESRGALWTVDLSSGEATLAKENLGRVRGIGALSDGRLVLADQLAHYVRIYNPSDKSLTFLAGARGIIGYADGTGEAAKFSSPRDVVVTEKDVIYVADTDNHRIRRITLDGVVTTFAGSGVASSTDGALIEATFDQPTGLALLEKDTLVVTEFYSSRVRLIEQGQVSTIAGSTAGFADNEDPLQGKLFATEGIVSMPPYLYLTDGNGGSIAKYHRVRRLTYP